MDFWGAWTLWGLLGIFGGRFFNDDQAWRLGWLAFLVAQLPLGIKEVLKWLGGTCG